MIPIVSVHGSAKEGWQHLMDTVHITRLRTTEAWITCGTITWSWLNFLTQVGRVLCMGWVCGHVWINLIQSISCWNISLYIYIYMAHAPWKQFVMMVTPLCYAIIKGCPHPPSSHPCTHQKTQQQQQRLVSEKKKVRTLGASWYLIGFIFIVFIHYFSSFIRVVDTVMEYISSFFFFL